MNKNSFYFDHDYSARNDNKILNLRVEFGWKGYGLFYAILETLCENGGYIRRGALGGLSLGLNTKSKELIDFLDKCIELELFKEDINLGIYNERILEHLDFRKKLSDAGRLGGSKKRKPPLSQAEAPPEAGKERKEEIGKERKDIKEKNTANDFSLISDPIKYKDKLLELTPEELKAYTKERYDFDMFNIHLTIPEQHNLILEGEIRFRMALMYREAVGMNEVRGDTNWCNTTIKQTSYGRAMEPEAMRKDLVNYCATFTDGLLSNRMYKIKLSEYLRYMRNSYIKKWRDKKV